MRAIFTAATLALLACATEACSQPGRSPDVELPLYAVHIHQFSENRPAVYRALQAFSKAESFSIRIDQAGPSADQVLIEMKHAGLTINGVTPAGADELRLFVYQEGGPVPDASELRAVEQSLDGALAREHVPASDTPGVTPTGEHI